ncbi:MAG: PKD domain-containing protein [Methanobacteriota archaeon]
MRAVVLSLLLLATGFAGCISTVEEVPLSTMSAVVSATPAPGWSRLEATVARIELVPADVSLASFSLTTGPIQADLASLAASPVSLPALEVAPGAFSAISFEFTRLEGARTGETGVVPIEVAEGTLRIDRAFALAAGESGRVAVTFDVAGALSESDGAWSFRPAAQDFSYEVDGRLVDAIELTVLPAAVEPATRDFAPPFSLSAPVIVVTDAAGNPVREAAVEKISEDTGATSTRESITVQELRFRADFPTDPALADRIVNFVWDMGDGNVLTGREVTHSFKEPGTKTIALRIEDPYGRKLVEELRLPVAEVRVVKGALLAGTAGNDAAVERDFREHAIRVLAGATSLAIELSWNAATATPAGADSPVPNNLYLTLVGPDAAEVLQVSDDANPKAGAVDAPAEGSYTAKVSAATGTMIEYTLTTRIGFA